LSEGTKRRYTREAELTRAEDHATLLVTDVGLGRDYSTLAGLSTKKEGTKTRHFTPSPLFAARAVP
jgi:hypothetical protein